jgi:hypothetical protein
VAWIYVWMVWEIVYILVLRLFCKIFLINGRGPEECLGHRLVARHVARSGTIYLAGFLQESNIKVRCLPEAAVRLSHAYNLQSKQQ